MFLIFFSVLAFLCIKHSHFTANIVLELMGYNIFLCTLRSSGNAEIEKSIISEKDLRGFIGSNVSLKSFNDDFKLEITLN